MSSKKSLPKNLHEGLVVDVELNGKFEFKAKLLRKTNSWRELEPYTWKEASNQMFNQNAIKESWVVEVIDKDVFTNGKQLVRWVPRYHSAGLIQLPDEDFSNYEEDEI